MYGDKKTPRISGSNFWNKLLFIKLIVYKLNINKDIRVEKFSQSYIKAAANTVDRNNARILTLAIEYTVNG